MVIPIPIPNAEALKDLNSPQLLALVALALIFAFFVLSRFFFVGGKPKFQAEREDRRDAISILQAQVERLEGKVESLEKQVERMNENEKWSREYRHALANQNHILLAAYEVATQYLNDALGEVGDKVSAHLREGIKRLKPARELLEDCPLPGPQQRS